MADDNVVYQETIDVTLSDRTEQEVDRIQQRLRGVLDQLEAIKRTPVQIQGLSQINQQIQQLTRQQHVVTLVLRNLAGAAINTIRASLTTLARGITIPVRVAAGAAQAVQRALFSPTGRFTGGVASYAAGNAIAGPGGGVIAAGLSQVGGPGATLAALGIGAAGSSLTSAMGFQALMTSIQNNTAMSDPDRALLQQAVLGMGQQTGADFTQLARGGMRAMNIGGNMPNALQVLDVAQQSAVSTGADVEQVTNVLANALHEYKADMGDIATVHLNVAHYMGVMHQAAAMSNMDLQTFSDYSGRAIGIAANLGVPLEQVAAAFVALTKHGYDAAQAQTQITDAMTHMINPTKEQQKALAELSNASGLDLLTAFKNLGAEGYDLATVIHMVEDAYKRTGLTEQQATQKTMQLMQALRGGLGLSTILGTGQDDFNKALDAFSDSAAIDQLTADSLARTHETLGNQVAVVKNIFEALGITLGEQLLPNITPLVQAFAQWLPSAIKTAGDVFNWLHNMWNALVESFTGDEGALGVVYDLLKTALGDNIANTVRPALQWLMDHMPAVRMGLLAFGAALAAVGGYFAALAAMSAIATAATGAFGAVLAVVTSPVTLAVLALTALAAIVIYAYQRIQPFHDAIDALGRIVGEVFAGDFDQAWQDLQAWMGNVMSGMGTLLSNLKDWMLNIALPAIAEKLGEWTGAYVHWVVDVAQKLPGELGQLIKSITGWITGEGGTQIKNAAQQFADAFLKALGDFITRGVPDALGKVAGFLGNLGSNFAAGFQTTAGGGSGADAMTAAAKLLGISDQDLGTWQGMLKQFENGSLNPLAFYGNAGNTDVGALDQAIQQGLAFGIGQMKPGTFTHYALPGHNDPHNPLDQALADARYIQGTYGGFSQAAAFRATHQGYASGGSFIVGGRQGVDQNLVAFRATRGERVTISRPGEARGQFVFAPQVDARGAAPGVEAAIEQRLRALYEEFKASFENMAVAAGA